MKVNEINWDKAPEDTTHYCTDPDLAPWVRYEDGHFYSQWAYGKWLYIKNIDAHQLIPKPEAIEQPDQVKNPKHYQLLGFETVEIIVRNLTVEQWRGACLFNALKYRMRAGKKDKLEQDIAKSNQFEIMSDKYQHLCIDWSE